MSGVGDPFTNPPECEEPSRVVANPLLTLLRSAVAGTAAGTVDLEAARRDAIAKYAFAVPTTDAVQAIASASPHGVIEIGAGAGYWAMQVHEHGVDVIAFDPEPAPSPDNTWFSGSEPWHVVVRGDHHEVSRHPQRSLLIVWPTKNEFWAAEAIEWFFVAGGQCVIYVGEPPGGRTGDDVFHAMLGDLTTCRQCRLGLDTAPCICGVTPRWKRSATVSLPHWPGCDDDLHIYTRRPEPWIKRWRSKRRT